METITVMRYLSDGEHNQNKIVFRLVDGKVYMNGILLETDLDIASFGSEQKELYEDLILTGVSSKRSQVEASLYYAYAQFEVQVDPSEAMMLDWIVLFLLGHIDIGHKLIGSITINLEDKPQTGSEMICCDFDEMMKQKILDSL